MTTRTLAKKTQTSKKAAKPATPKKPMMKSSGKVLSGKGKK